MAYFIHSIIAIAKFLTNIIIAYIHQCIVYDRTKQQSDYPSNTVHVIYLAIGCF